MTKILCIVKNNQDLKSDGDVTWNSKSYAENSVNIQPSDR